MALDDQAVRSVVVLNEVLGISAGIATTVLWKEYTVGVVGPAWTCDPNVVGPETIGQEPGVERTSYVVHDSAHAHSLL